MKKYSGLALLAAMLIMLSSCGSEKIVFNEPTVKVSKKGAISQTIVEKFDKDYYDADELKDEFNSAIDDFKKESNEGEITLSDLYTDNGEVFVSLEYSSSEAAKAFNNEDIFYGTVNDAYDNGYTLDVNLKGVEDGTLIGKSELMEMDKNHIFIVSSAGIVYTPYKVMFVSAGVEVLGDKEVRVSSDSDGLAYIVMK